MRIGVYGGTFNPPHLGHTTAARAAFAMLSLDRLLMIPDGMPPHKELPSGSPSAEQRLELVRIAAEGMELGSRVEVPDLELRRQGKSYTSDTLAQIHTMYPEDDLWLLMGSDMFLTLHRWHEPAAILSLAGIAAFGRTAADTEEQFAAQRSELLRTWPRARILTLSIPGVVDVSSTKVRERLAEGRGEDLLDPAVYGCILREGLYGTGADLRRLPLAQLRPVALSYLSRRRIPHVLGVEQEAVRLAQRYGADVSKARVAALLHDCTKKLKHHEQLALCRQYGIVPDDVEQREPQLLHARTGAALAEDVFGVDEEIYGAIRFHTTGRAGMTVLEKIIYLADSTEPGRDFPGVDELRRVCGEDLDSGMLLALEMTAKKIEEAGSVVHRATVEARKALKG